MPSIHTAQILVGRIDDQGWTGGINPSHVVWLTENGAAGIHLDRWWPPWAGDPPWSPGRSASIAHTAAEAGLDPSIAEGTQPEWYRHPESPITWIPRGPDHILEDALLMIAIHVLRDEALVEATQRHCPALLASREQGITDLGELNGPPLADLHKRCRTLDWSFKLVVTMFQGSTLAGQQRVLENYSMPVEVCTVSYHRRAPEDGGDALGSLAPPLPWDPPLPPPQS
jgi:hypothetical protein